MDMEYLSRAKVQETEREIVRVQLAAEAQSPMSWTTWTLCTGGLRTAASPSSTTSATDRTACVTSSSVTRTAFGCASPRLCRKSDLPAKTPATVIPVIVCLGRRR